MGFMHALFHSRHHHRGHHRFGRWGHHVGGHAHDDEAFHGHDGREHIDHLAHKIAKRLDLNDEQQARLRTLIECLQAQREAVRGHDWLQDASALFNARTFDRDAAQAQVSARLATVQQAVPNVLDAVAGFYDALDADQQQVLRFIIRVGRRVRGGHDRSGAQ